MDMHMHIHSLIAKLDKTMSKVNTRTHVHTTPRNINMNKTINDDINNGASLSREQINYVNKQKKFENISIAFLVWHVNVHSLDLMQSQMIKE